MRLIDADALRELWVCQPGHDFEPSAFVYSIDLQPTIPAPRWVRCEVDMPTKAGRYLVMDKDGDFNVDEWHNTFGWRFITPFDADRITHWMPIEPPKEDA